MIQLDPDIDISLLPISAASSAEDSPRQHRLPTTRTLERFFALAQTTVRLKGQVSVLLTTDPAIRRLNRQFRGKNKATDVLSFPSEGAFPGLPASQQMAGDLAISIPTALKQAIGQGHSLSTEVKVLLLHGLLHLAGYDHETDTGQMARRERLLRAKLGLPQGLIERVAKGTGNREQGSGVAGSVKSARASAPASQPLKPAAKSKRP
jgi:probable rRNA maturation factor